ncbi:MAG TPA: SUMF1/EgtB/PvdO family nonheme iron enzyme [Gemmata sp.]|nr:SUMF1/EgtB/PvdO family nonheme iron enzyme [Gemmata sp.]
MRGHIAKIAAGLLLAGLAVAGVLHAEPGKEAEKKRVDDLIRQLGHEEFEKREAAGKELVAVGERALPSLHEAATRDEHPEVRYRAPGVVRAILWRVRTSQSTGLETVPLAAREFVMGSPRGEGYRRADETQHKVRLTRPFLVGATEVTQAQYEKVMGVNPSWFAETGGGKAAVEGLDTSEFPVERVTWFDAIEFCNRLSKLDGYEPYYKLGDVKKDGGAITGAAVTVLGGNGYRLPTEAEWEYACRAGWGRAFNYGGYNNGRQANLRPAPDAGGYGGPPSWKAVGRTTKVKSYPASGWGLYDVHGNVGEWCWDWYAADYYEKSPRDDPRGPDAGTTRVTRGGSWMVAEGSCRAASRLSLAPGERKDFTGFRVARSP